MKVNAITLGIVAVVWILAFAGSVGGMYFYTLKNLPKPLPVEVVQHNPEEEKEALKGEEGHIPTIESKEDMKAVIEELKTWRSDLDSQRVNLLKLDADIQRRETLMKAEKSALDNEREKIVNLQKDLSNKIKEFESKQLMIQEEQNQSIKELTDVFGKMKTDQAVNLIRAYPDDQVTRFFAYLPRKQLAKMLELWSKNYPEDRDRLVRVTEELRRVAKQEAAGSTTSTPPAP